MGAGKMLSLDERKQIQGFHTEGLSHREIARRIGRSSSAVRRFLKDPDGYHTKLGTGRPPKLAPEDVDRLLRAASESQASARELRDGLGLDVSVSRVNGYLRHAQRRRSSLTPVSGGIPAVATAGVDQQEADELPLALGISGSDAQEPASRYVTWCNV